MRLLCKLGLHKPEYHVHQRYDKVLLDLIFQVFCGRCHKLFVNHGIIINPVHDLKKKHEHHYDLTPNKQRGSR